MNGRVRQGLQYLGNEFSASRDEFHTANGPGSPMVLDALIGNGYVTQKDDRVALTECGRRALGEIARAAGA